LDSNFKITNKFSRFSLHDSSVENFYKDNEITFIEFSWGFLENYSENGIDEGIVLGKTIMKVKGYKNEKFRLDYSGTADFKNKKPEYLIYNQNLFKFWDVISKNSINENNNSFKISGFYEDNIFCWIDWTFEFESIEISWKNYVLHKDWLNGQLVIEK
jgi:hypothetical protein